MTKARDLSSVIGSSGQIDNTKITLDVNEIPALDTAKITTGTFDASRIGSGTFADARISQSSVSQHATSFDDNKIVNDISTLALRQASDANRSAYNTNSQFVDVFQDNTGITNLTNSVRTNQEYIISGTQGYNGSEVLLADAQTYTAPQVESGSFDTNLIKVDLWNVDTGNANNVFTNGYNTNGSQNGNKIMWGMFSKIGSLTVNDDTYEGFGGYDSGGGSFNRMVIDTGRTAGLDEFFITKFNFRSGQGNGTTTLKGSNDGTTFTTLGSIQHPNNTYGYATVSSFANSTFYRYLSFEIAMPISGPNWALFMSQLALYGQYYTTNVSATGSFENNTITAPSSVSSMGAIITYQDQTGTNALNTDIVLQLSADGGSNYSTATLTALPNFATGIKMAKVNDLAVTAGTQLKYRLNFANQSLGSKEARIRGVALQY